MSFLLCCWPCTLRCVINPPTLSRKCFLYFAQEKLSELVCHYCKWNLTYIFNQTCIHCGITLNFKNKSLSSCLRPTTLDYTPNLHVVCLPIHFFGGNHSRNVSVLQVLFIEAEDFQLAPGLFSRVSRSRCFCLQRPWRCHHLCMRNGVAAGEVRVVLIQSSPEETSGWTPGLRISRR